MAQVLASALARTCAIASSLSHCLRGRAWPKGATIERTSRVHWLGMANGPPRRRPALHTGATPKKKRNTAALRGPGG
eukprot:7750110-Lingulodinium_polyedra.AAC.1